jgi:hypothetical protein
MAKVFSVEIPFPILRLLLPKDGEVVTHILKRDQWRNEETPFFRHEAVELAFGRKLRAELKDRDKEQWWKPGIVDKGDRVALRGGWRVHKKIILHNDFFDGAFQADLSFSIENGELAPRISGLDIEWNKSAAGKILEVIVEAIEPIVERELQKTINKFLKDFLPGLVNDFIAQNELLKDLKARSTLALKGTTMVVSVRVD